MLFLAGHQHAFSKLARGGKHSGSVSFQNKFEVHDFFEMFVETYYIKYEENISSQEFITMRGVTQGEILSPLLFITLYWITLKARFHYVKNNLKLYHK